MALLDELFHFLTNGNIFGLPPLVVMIVPFILGLVIGYLVKKFLRIAIIVGIVVVIASYFGFFGLSLASLKDLADKYGPIALQYGVLLIGILPLSLGFVVGLIIGFIFG